MESSTPDTLPVPSLRARVLVCVVVLVMALGIGEVGLRVLGIGSRDVKPTDPRTGLRTFPPGEDIPYRTSCFSNVMRINADGFHARDHAREKQEGVTRIVMVGDSFVEAAQVDRDKTFPALLEDQLNAVSDKPVEVIALGQSGNGNYANLQYLATYGVAAKPDVVLAMYNINDIQNDAGYDRFTERVDAIVNGAQASMDTPARSGDTSPFVAWVKRMGKKSSLVVVGYTAYLNMRARLAPPVSTTETGVSLIDASLYLPALPPGAAEAWDRQTQLFQAMKTVTERAGARFLMASITADDRVDQVHYQKALPQLPEGAPTDPFALEKRLAAAAEAMDVPYLPTVDGFSKLRTASGTAAFPCDGHYNEAGNAYMATLLSQWFFEHPEWWRDL